MKIGFYYSEAKVANLLQHGADHIPLINNMVLSRNELRLLSLACSDRTYKEIAREMGGISVKTLDHYREGLFSKLNVRSRVGLVMYALENGIIPKREK